MSAAGVPSPQSLPPEKESEGETGGRAAPLLALRSFLNSSFILPGHSVLLSIALVTRRSIQRVVPAALRPPPATPPSRLLCLVQGPLL